MTTAAHLLGGDGLARLAADVATAVSAFGAAVTPRLASLAGEPEDQMRGPLEALLDATAASLGVRFSAVGEASLADLRVRPDYATLTNGAITGYVEVKRPGRGADPTRWSASSHDGVQWSKLRALPNVLYTDGQQWGLYRTGERVGELVTLTGDLHTSGAALSVVGDGLARLLSDFLLWKPVPPRSISQLVNSVAPLTRLLREEVADTLTREQRVGGGPFTRIATDWRALLFPDADDAAFADQYAQAVTFALLLARTENIDFTDKAVDGIARELGRTHSLLGKALAVLTDETIGALTVTLDTLVRVIGVVDFRRFAHHRADPYLHLYEYFLAVYDPELRKLTGSYYTPTAVVTGMTRLTDEVLRTRLGREAGLADPTVTIVDPAMGTGPYVLDVLETIAETTRAQQGPGAVPAQLKEAAARIVGVEKQTGPFAVAELRVAEALHRHGASAPVGGVRLYVADTLDNPFAEQAHLAATLDPIAISRRQANKMKAEEPVVVVLGNPPYRENAAGMGGFVEHGAPNTSWSTPLLNAFKEPGTGRYQKDLANLYVYFWRWATWKVFDAHPENPDGVICFITTSGYLKGPGFAGMRRYLRAHASEGWIIDGTPEGHQPEVNTRIFGGVQQPVAIGLFVRRTDTDADVPARVRYRALRGRQESKFDELKALSIDDADGWEDCPTSWTAPFLPTGGDEWAGSPALGDLLPWQSPGITPNRTWVYAPLAATLRERWRALLAAPPEERPGLFKETVSSNLVKRKPGLAGFAHAALPVAEETGECLVPVPVAYRSFDVQHLIPDDRLMHRPRADLWSVKSDHQVWVTEQHDQSGQSGPGLTFAAHVPDAHHYNGRGGRVLPLYAAADASRPNVAPGLLELLSDRLVAHIGPEHLLAYIAAVTAHPGFTARFADDLRTPGIRVPLSANPELWSTAVTVGRRVLWLHTRGERMVDLDAGRPPGSPRLSEAERPMVLTAIPDTPTGMPDELSYDPATRELAVGAGRIGPVESAVWTYEVSRMNVLRKWFGYRRATRPKTRGEQSSLDDIRPTSWPAAYTTDLLQLIEVLTLVTALEPEQEQLLNRVMEGPRITVYDLTAAGVLPVSVEARSLPGTAAGEAPEQGVLPGV